ncbi:MAG: hypothetical protein C4K49_10125 [Candidatus Thorarchaeota archaeon]|nr:MAG: hypothetical protein C4K49_10125 [Candidatus Thorarchaeota archaeon]
MSSVWTRAYNKTPKIDCGLCGLTRCANFARAAMVGDVAVGSCPILTLPDFSGMRVDLESLVVKGTGTYSRPAPPMLEGGVLLTSPCKDTVDRVMAEMRVFNGVKQGELMRFLVFDPLVLCDMIECLSDEFEVTKCSRDLGMVRADTGDMSITLLQDGRVNMRRVLDLEHVHSLFDKIERAAIAAIICNCCGQDLLSVLGEVSSGGDTRIHPVLNAGSGLTLAKAQVRLALKQVDLATQIGEESRDVTIALAGLWASLQSNVRSSLEGASQKTDIRPALKNTWCQLVRLACDSRTHGRETIVVKTLYLLWTVESAAGGLTQLEQIFPRLSADNARRAQKMLAQAIEGHLPRMAPEEGSPDLFLVYSHLNRIDRAAKAVKVWNST